MPVLLGSKGQAGFDEPLELLKDCHRRIESFLEMLLKVAAGEDRLNEERRRALEAALKYFREAAPRHTQDEEQSLFPRLRAKGVGREALERVKALTGDHVRANTLHAAVDTAGVRWLVDGELGAVERETLRGQLDELQSLYQRHIAVEDGEIFPLAGRALDAGELAAIGGR